MGWILPCGVKGSGYVASLLALSTASWAQSEATRPQASGPVTIGEFVGAVVTARIIQEQVIRRDGNQFPVRQQADLHLVVRSNTKIERQIYQTSYSPRGVRKANSGKLSFTLEQPTEPKFLGSGHAVWFFDKETLTNLRVYKGGAFKREILFARGASGLTCTVTDAFLREDGVGSIELRSAVDGTPVKLISSKQVSSSCQVTKPK